MHLQLRLKIILTGLDVTGDLSWGIALDAREHLSGGAFLPVDDRIAEADAAEVGVHSPDAHALHTARETKDHLREGNDSSGRDAPAGDADEATPPRGTGEHLFDLVRARAVGRIVASLHAREKGGKTDVVSSRQLLPLDPMMLAREGDELGGICSLRERNAHARLLPSLLVDRVVNLGGFIDEAKVLVDTMRAIGTRHVDIQTDTARSRGRRCRDRVSHEGRRHRTPTVSLGDAQQVDVGLRTPRSHPALRGTTRDRVANDLTRGVDGDKRPPRVEVVHRVVPPQGAQRGAERLLECLHVDSADLILRNLIPRHDPVAVARLRGNLTARKIPIHHPIGALSKEACRDIEAATIGHVCVDEVRNGHRHLGLGTKSLDEHLAGASILPVQQGAANSSPTPMRVNVRADDGGRRLVNATQDAHGRHGTDVSFRIKTDDRVDPIASVLALHHVRDVLNGRAPDGVVVVFNQGDERVHGGRVTADHGPPAQPEVVARVRDGPGRRESLRKSCHANHLTG